MYGRLRCGGSVLLRKLGDLADRAVGRRVGGQILFAKLIVDGIGNEQINDREHRHAQDHACEAEEAGRDGRDGDGEVDGARVQLAFHGGDDGSDRGERERRRGGRPAGDVDDAEDADRTAGLVLAGDITRLVNGLFVAGAEAISINGRRLTTLTPIRSAGAAITVDYVSLSPPYTLQAIGDPATLPARFNETDAAQWWHYLTQNYGLTLSIKMSEDDLELPADSGMTLRYAERG